jgi:hypothetical protein
MQKSFTGEYGALSPKRYHRIMKAKELTHILLQYPDLDVLVDGYEAGYEDIKAVAIGRSSRTTIPKTITARMSCSAKPKIRLKARQPKRRSS